MTTESIPLTLEKSEWLTDWYLIVRAEHEGKEWMENDDSSYQCSERISDADVEGYSAEMKSIAAAIEKRASFKAKRCAVEVMGDGSVHFWSPRNSTRPGIVTLADADALAQTIRKEVR